MFKYISFISILMLLSGMVSAANICEDEQNLASVGGINYAYINFENFRNEPVKLYWLNYAGDRVLYEDNLVSGSEWGIWSFTGNIWLVADQNDNCLEIFGIDGDAHIPINDLSGNFSEGCELQAAVSGSSNVSRQITIRNGIALKSDPYTQALNIYWKDFSGGEVLYKSGLLPGETWSIDSYDTHPWIVRNHEGECVAGFVPEEHQYYTVTATDPGIAGDMPITKQQYCAQLSPSGCTVAGDGVMAYPSNGLGGISTVRKWPLVIIAHGTGYGNQEYDYLQEHLARNGFFNVSVHKGTNSAKVSAAAIMMHVSYLQANYGNFLNGHIALIGHSNGGEVIIDAAEQIKNGSNMFTVKALAALAPSNKDNYPLDFAVTPAYMVMPASNDEDLIGVNANGFPFYDLIGAESSNTAAVDRIKSSIYIYGSTHAGFSDRNNMSGNKWIFFGSSAGAANQRFITQSYINAFLRWRVNNEKNLNGYLKYRWQPVSVQELRYAGDMLWSNGLGVHANDQPPVIPMYSELSKVVVDNFSNGSVGTNTMGGAVFANNATIAEAESVAVSENSPHSNRVMRVLYNASGYQHPIVRFELPSNWQDFNANNQYHSLALRVGLIHPHANNIRGEDLRMSLILYSSGGSTTINTSDWWTLPYPARNEGRTQFDPYIDLTRSNMQSIVIPLTAFTSLNNNSIQAITLDFYNSNGSGVSKGAVQLDNIEFLK